MLLFNNPEAASHIFAGWLKELGKRDEGERLRVSVITGIDREKPSAYRVVISTNLKSSRSAETKHFVIVSRINEMKPPTSENLDRFLESYRTRQEYLLIPATGSADGIKSYAPRLGIVKRELMIRPAWQIERHDPDACAIEAEDKLVIPEGVSNPPVLEVLAWKRRAVQGVRTNQANRPSVTDTLHSQQKQRIGRNDPCHCGSGKKYKRCHGV